MVNAFREPGMERYWVPSTPASALFGTRISDATYLVKVGGDLAFLNAVQKVLIERGWHAREFVEAATRGFDRLRSALDAQPLEDLLQASGTTRAQVESFAGELARAERGVFVWSMGITQHAGGGDTVRALVNLGLLREYVGRPGTGMMPIRGHSGVQGGAEMGAYATAFPGGLPVDAGNAAHLARLWGFEVPAEPGLTTVEYLEAALAGGIDALWCIGGNFLETMPQPQRIEQALARIPLRVHTDVVLTTQMLVDPGEVVYVLPARTRYEQRDGGTQTSTERRVIFSPEIPGRRVGQARSEWELLLDLARAARPADYARVHFDSGAAIRADIERAVPAYAGIAALSKQGDQFQWGGPRLCAERVFPTADGRAHFQPVFARPAAPAADGATFVLATRRGKQFNSMVQRERDDLTGAERDHVLVSPADARRLRLVTGDRVLLQSAVGELAARVLVAEVAEGTLQAHWPEANVLIPAGRVDADGGVPDYNATVRLLLRP
jgi:molybdopterin-dependent oxidoreductase alpha subunit